MHLLIITYIHLDVSPNRISTMMFKLLACCLRDLSRFASCLGTAVSSWVFCPCGRVHHADGHVGYGRKEIEQCSKPLLVDDYRKSYATTIPYAKLRIIMIIIQFQPTSTVELQLQIGTLFILNKPFEI